MLLEEPVAAPRLEPSSPRVVSVEPYRPELAEGDWKLDDEVSDFITRHILEKDTQFFDG